jgi:hypothetical protein
MQTKILKESEIAPGMIEARSKRNITNLAFDGFYFIVKKNHQALIYFFHIINSFMFLVFWCTMPQSKIEDCYGICQVKFISVIFKKESFAGNLKLGVKHR